jgi:hypothetical protein
MVYKKKSRKMKGGVMPPRKLPVIGEDDNITESPFEDLDISSIERVSDADLSDIGFDESVNMSDISAIEPDNSEMNEITMNEDVSFGDEPSISPENDTTIDDSSGGRTRRRIMNKKHKRGTRKNKRKGTRKHNKTRSKSISRSRTKKYKKGGANIGCNTNDPNFSIYNTNMLKLFPYKA